MALNTCVLMGRLTKDAELRQAKDITVVNFTLAVDKPYNKNNDHPEANWIDCVAFGKTAEFISKYFHKGSKFAVTGRLQTRTYENKNGAKIKVTEVVVESVEFVESKKQSEENAPSASTAGTAADTGVVSAPDNEDIPF